MGLPTPEGNLAEKRDSQRKFFSHKIKRDGKAETKFLPYRSFAKAKDQPGGRFGRVD